MPKNLIYITAIDSQSTKVKNSDYAQYSIQSWTYWCNKNKVDLFVNRENKFNRPIWNKSLVYEHGFGYDFIGVVDSDTIIHPNAPNIFERLNPYKFYGVNDLCDLNWLFSSINDRQKFFPNTEIDISKYINAGVAFFSQKHLEIWKKFLTFVLENEPEIEKIQGGGKEQTLLNFFLQQEKVQIELLSPGWNLLSMHKKNMFIHNWQLNKDKVPHFIKYAHIWHFTGFPIEDRTQIMKETYNLIFK
jgi:hypothetical protein